MRHAGARAPVPQMPPAPAPHCPPPGPAQAEATAAAARLTQAIDALETQRKRLEDLPQSVLFRLCGSQQGYGGGHSKASLVTRLIDDANDAAAEALGDAAAQVTAEAADLAVKAERLSAFEILTAVECADLILSTERQEKYKEAFIAYLATGMKAKELTHLELEMTFGIGSFALRKKILSKITSAIEDGFEQ